MAFPIAPKENSVVGIDEFALLLCNVPEETIPANFSIKAALRRSQIADKGIHCQVFGIENPIPIEDLLPPIKIEIATEKVTNASDSKVTSIWLTRCGHLIKTEALKDPKTNTNMDNCPHCNQKLGKNQPFQLYPNHFSTLTMDTIEKIIPLSQSVYLKKRIPANAPILSALSEQTILLSESENNTSFIVTPCKRACDLDSYIQQWKNNDKHCPCCEGSHDFDLPNSDAAKAIVDIDRLPEVINNKITPLQREFFDEALSTNAIIRPTFGDTEPFSLKAIFDPDISEIEKTQNLLKFEEFLLMPCCKNIIHKNYWLNHLRSKWKGRSITLLSSFKPSNIACPCCNKEIEPQNYLSNSEKKTLTWHKWLSRITVVALTAIALVGIFSICLVVSLGDRLIKIFFPFAAGGLGWENTLSKAVSSLSFAGKAFA